MEMDLQIDLDKIWPGGLALAAGEAMMDQYENTMKRRPTSQNTLIYLSTAETDLKRAKEQGADVSSQREKLNRLKEAHKRKYLDALV